MDIAKAAETDLIRECCLRAVYGLRFTGVLPVDSEPKRGLKLPMSFQWQSVSVRQTHSSKFQIHPWI
jgi:hypothetical protein